MSWNEEDCPRGHSSSRCSPANGSVDGFSLVELVIALSVSTLVLVGIVGVAAQMVRFQMEGAKRGKVTGWTLIGLMNMTQELEDASVLVEPYTSPPDSDTLRGCTNYTINGSPPGRLDAALPNTAFYYCVPASGGWANTLLRYSATGSPAVCPLSPTPTCGSGTFDVVARDVRKLDSLTTYFRRSDDSTGVEVRMFVGDPTPSTNSPIPVYLRVREKIGMNRSLGGPD